MEIKTIIFDCDGTLSQSDEAYFQGFCDALIHYGFKPPTIDEYQDKYSGKIIQDIIRLYGDELGEPLSPDVEAYYWTLEPAYLEKYTVAVSGAVEAVDRLQRKFTTCVASNNSVELVQYLLNAADLDDKFPEHHIFSSEQVGVFKPAPDVFLHALEKMLASPDSAIIIEDSLTGVKAGVAAGVRVIGFAGTSPNVPAKIQRLLQAGATVAFGTWPEIVSYIESLS